MANSTLGCIWDGAEVDVSAGFIVLGRIGEKELLALADQCLNHSHSDLIVELQRERLCIDPYHPGHGQPIGDSIKGIGPVSISNMSWLKELAPWLVQTQTRQDWMTADYVEMHNDAMVEGEFRGVLFVVLRAPRGCKFVFEETVVELQPGSVVLFDDHRDHGVYPTALTDLYSGGDSRPHRQDYAKDNCMSFLLITKGYALLKGEPSAEEDDFGDW
ncbi:hypothetical protein ACYPKM_04590 [Pseudomonas aeruginosa]